MAAFNSMPAMPSAPAPPSDAMGMNHGPPQAMAMDSFDPDLNFHDSLLYVVRPFRWPLPAARPQALPALTSALSPPPLQLKMSH